MIVIKESVRLPPTPPKVLAAPAPAILTAAARKCYKALLIEVKRALTRGLLAAQRALEYQRLKSYWEIGRGVDTAVAASSGALRLNSALYQLIREDIQKETGFDLTADMIGRMVQLYIKGCNDPCKIAAQGGYLNQVLLDQGLAEMY